MSWIIAGLVLLALVATVALAGYRWRRESRRLMARLDPGNGPSGAPVLSAAELAGLPDPVARYLRAVLHEGQPIARHALVLHRGDFLLRPGENGWRPFTSSEHFAVQPPGFVWDARIRMVPALPGLDVLVRDSFVSGRGSMHGSVLGLVPVVAAEGTPEMAAGALYRYLAEAAWIPTAFLPRHGVVWTAIDESSARATLCVEGTTVALDFHFGSDGLVERVFAPARFREVQGRYVQTPWQGRFSDYQERGGMRIPLAAEVEWLLPECPQVYWRGRVTGVSFE